MSIYADSLHQGTAYPSNVFSGGIWIDPLPYGAIQGSTPPLSHPTPPPLNTEHITWEKGEMKERRTFRVIDEQHLVIARIEFGKFACTKLPVAFGGHGNMHLQAAKKKEVTVTEGGENKL